MGPAADPTPNPRRGRLPDGRSIWLTPRAIGMHVTLLVVVPAFIGLFWWQIQRVRQGNTLSWAYVFEWPFFTAYAVYMWWKLVHDQTIPVRQSGPVDQDSSADLPLASATPGSASGPPHRERSGAVADVATASRPSGGGGGTAGAGPDAGLGDVGEGGGPDGEDPAAAEELAAYNRYLAQLDASGRRKHW